MKRERKIQEDDEEEEADYDLHGYNGHRGARLNTENTRSNQRISEMGESMEDHIVPENPPREDSKLNQEDTVSEDSKLNNEGRDENPNMEDQDSFQESRNKERVRESVQEPRIEAMRRPSWNDSSNYMTAMQKAFGNEMGEYDMFLAIVTDLEHRRGKRMKTGNARGSSGRSDQSEDSKLHTEDTVSEMHESMEDRENPEMDNQDSFQESQNEVTKRPSSDDAFNYMAAVKNAFASERGKYDLFLTTMKDFKAHRCNLVDFFETMLEIMEGRDSLILGLNIFLPKGYKIPRSFLRSRRNVHRNAVTNI